jgi:hypothetical protein
MTADFSCRDRPSSDAGEERGESRRVSGHDRALFKLGERDRLLWVRCEGEV